MKKVLLSLSIGCLLSTSAFAVKVNIQGTGGLESDGSNNMVCVNSASNTCATLNVSSSGAVEAQLIINEGQPTEEIYDVHNIQVLPPAELEEAATEQNIDGSLIVFEILP